MCFTRRKFGTAQKILFALALYFCQCTGPPVLAPSLKAGQVTQKTTWNLFRLKWLLCQWRQKEMKLYHCSYCAAGWHEEIRGLTQKWWLLKMVCLPTWHYCEVHTLSIFSHYISFWLLGNANGSMFIASRWASADGKITGTMRCSCIAFGNDERDLHNKIS